MRKPFAYVVFLIGLLSVIPALAEPLTVAIAANLSYVFDDLASAFKQETGIEVQGIRNASGKLATQIRNGAPYDVFMSADREFPDTLVKDGFAIGPTVVYAHGVLVLWTNSTLNLKDGVTGLNQAGIAKIAIANPKVAPFGKQALNALSYFHMREAVNDKLVYAESIAQAAQYVESKAAQVGFIAKSIVIAPEMQGKGQWVAVPEEAYQAIEQGAVVLKHGAETHADASKRFLQFLQSSTAKAILEKNGYQLP